MHLSHHEIAHAYCAAVMAGDLPDSLLTPDFSAWLTTAGDVDKATYQNAVRLLARMCKEPIRLTVDAITAEADRVVIEARSTATLINDEPYENTYVFSLRVRDGKIAWIAEHYNAITAQKKLLPLMAKLGAA